MAKRENTLLKERKIIREFRWILRSEHDYSCDAMYKDVGKKNFLSARQTQDIVRSHYSGIITQPMIDFIRKHENEKHETKVSMFASAFKFCNRESRLIIRYITRK